MSKAIHLKHAVDQAAAEFEAARIKLEKAQRDYAQAQQPASSFSAQGSGQSGHAASGTQTDC
ncbi:MAG TPA: hypothetical protein VF450_21200 [Noviherbaspirillum sp.]